VKAKTALIRAILSTILAVVLAAAALAVPEPARAFEPEARAIMERFYHRPDGDDRKARITLTLTNKSGRTRIRGLASYSKDYGPDRKTVMVFSEPADVKGTMYLSWDYGEVGREDDKWLYLPAMRKDRRISGTSRNESFMGTDFTYDDLDRRLPEKDEQRLLGEESVGGRESWVIECIPVEADESYTRRVAWVSKEELMVVKAEYYDGDGLLKVFEVRRIERIGDYSVAADCLMRNVVASHQTEMVMEGMEYDTGLSDDLFEVATLRRGRL
jgi:hypothetical protein